jgi:hypothetical protein
MLNELVKTIAKDMRMNRKRGILAIALAAGVLTACSDAFTSPNDPPIRHGESFYWRGMIDPGGRLEIKGINGAIRAVAAAGDEVEVEGIKTGRHYPPSDVSIQVVEHANGVTICARYPDTSGGLSPCTPGDELHVNLRTSDVKVEFTVSLPEDVILVARTVNGELRGDHLGSDAFMQTVNGDVHVSTDGVAEATTVNGSITASIGRTDWGCDLDFLTVNGGITLTIPAGSSARVGGSTVNGNITTDFPLTIHKSGPARTIRGTLGVGAWRLGLTTVNGNIELAKRDY